MRPSLAHPCAKSLGAQRILVRLAWLTTSEDIMSQDACGLRISEAAALEVTAIDKVNLLVWFDALIGGRLRHLNTL
jgi:hypothetical protein